MASRDLAHTAGDPLEVDVDLDLCPLCGLPLRPTIEPTEDGWEWVGECVDCNTIVEIN